ncbi:MAG: GNAT family N-acetyltransferase [Candidatus Marinimicrobia bacterium]|nr:GNAT family N-acetyltransferase [Candidatus Neomarinimicrobiota bacterium]MBL7067060.1 GNAT family N-acetyltransferase [Candidatus Neomarinimicrobiota bacterium]
MSVEIREVKSRRDLRKFVRFPLKLYHKHPYWVPSLIRDELNSLSPKSNPAFEFCEAKCWLAYQEGKIVGRITAILNNRHEEKWGKRQVRFGWIDFIDDPDVSTALLTQVEVWAREKGAESVHGPLGFTDFDHEGMLVEGFDELGTMAAIYNYPYYPQHLDKLGYKKDVDWVEYQITIPDKFPEEISHYSKIIQEKRGFYVLNAKSMKEILPYADEMFDVLQQAYQQLYGFVFLTKKQIDTYIKQYLGFITPDYIGIVLNREGRVIGFGITLPSLSHALQKSKGRLFPFGFIHFIKAMKKNDILDLYLIGVHPDYQGKGVAGILMNKMGRTFIKHGIKYAESNPELELNNRIQAQWKHFEKRQHKRRRCYIKELQST